MGMTSEGEQMDSMADESQERQQFEFFFCLDACVGIVAHSNAFDN